MDLSGSDAAVEAAEVLRQTGADYWDVFLHSLRQSTVEARSSLRGSRFGPVRSTSRTSQTEGAGLRVIRDGLVGFVATADHSSDGLRRALDSPDLEPRTDVQDVNAETRAPAIPRDNFLNHIATELLDTCLAAHDLVSSAEVQISRIEQRRLVSTADRADPLSDGTCLLEARGSISLGGHEVWAVKTVRGEATADVLDIIATIGRQLVSKAARHSQRGLVINGDFPVVLGSGWGAVWIHEAVGHQLEADCVEAGQSVFSELMHHLVAPENVTIVDNPQVDGGRVAQAFDDEGVASKETTLIENGRLVNLLTDRLTSIRTGLPLTGNGRRAHYAQRPGPRMTNLLLLPGIASPESLVGSVRRGILVVDVRHAWFEPDSGTVRLLVVESKLIEQGQTTSDLAPMILSADPRSLLSGIGGIGDDFALESDRGYCSKGGAVIPVGVGQPAVLVNSMTAGPIPPK